MGIKAKNECSLLQVHRAATAVTSAFIRKSVELDAVESATLQLPGWQELKQLLMRQHGPLVICDAESSYSITCAFGAADAVLERVHNFLAENAIREEFVATATVGMAVVVDRYHKSEISSICDDFVACSVSVSMVMDDVIKGSGILVRGTVHGLKNAVRRIREMLSEVSEQVKTVDRPGMPQFLQSTRGQMALRSIEVNRRAYIGEVVEDAGKRAATMAPSVGLAVKLTVSVGKKFTMKVVCGDITEYRVDAIVNAANGSLDHGGGLARCIVDKGTKYRLIYANYVSP